MGAANRWAGPALCAGGLILATGLVAGVGGVDPTLRTWIATQFLSAERIGVLAGLGLGIGLAASRPRLGAAMLFAAGLAVGLVFRDAILDLLEVLPGARTGLYLTGPIAGIAVGIALVAGPRQRPFALLASAAIAGAMQSLAIALTDPTPGGTAVIATGLAASAWITGSVALSVATFARPWLTTGATIAGSWLVAAGLLHAAASMVPPKVTLPPAQPTSPSPAASNPP